MHIVSVQQSNKLGIWRILGHCDKLAHYFVAISIFFLTTYRHPFVGAVIDRPCKCTEFQHKFTLNGTFLPKEMRISDLFLPGAQ